MDSSGFRGVCVPRRGTARKRGCKPVAAAACLEQLAEASAELACGESKRRHGLRVGGDPRLQGFIGREHGSRVPPSRPHPALDFSELNQVGLRFLPPRDRCRKALLADEAAEALVAGVGDEGGFHRDLVVTDDVDERVDGFDSRGLH